MAGAESAKRGDETMVYEWKVKGLYKVSADVAADVMNQLAEQDNLNAQALVEASEAEDAPLHDEFEWDNDIAGDEWRKHQARRMINALVIKKEAETEEKPCRMFFKVETGTSNYESIDAIVRSENKMQKLADSAYREFLAFQTKYQQILKLAKAEQIAMDFADLLQKAKGDVA